MGHIKIREIMKTIINKIIFWLNCARVYSLPITILNWLVIFVYSIKHGGNIILGVICLFGIGLVHMATNLIDDYFDYRILSKDENFINSAQNCKCKYLKDNLATTTDLRNAIITFLGIATFIGIILFITSGVYVALLAIMALAVALLYQRLSLKGLGEIAVIFAYGPLLYEGVYYVMTSRFSLFVLVLSLACAFFTNTILYTHMLMDYDGDECSHKKTLCRYLKNKNNALNFILFFYGVSFVLLGFLASKTLFYLLPFLTIPLIIDLYNALKNYNDDKTHLPVIRFWHYPLDKWNELKNTSDAPFYFRFFYSRNIVTIFMLLTCIAILQSK